MRVPQNNISNSTAAYHPIGRGREQFRRKRYFLHWLGAAFFLICFMWWITTPPAPLTLKELEKLYPLSWQHIQMANGTGGRWYIPPSWLESSHHPVPTNILDAATLALKVSYAPPYHTIAHSSIPLIIHQTWKNSRIETWSHIIRDSVEKWLQMCTSDRPMAYFLWEDDGMMSLVEEMEKDLRTTFDALPAKVEQADVFRIAVCKWFGGVYADTDVEPLKHPANWVRPQDLTSWLDPGSGLTYSPTVPLAPSYPPPSATQPPSRPVNLIFGIEGDNDPTTDTHWRMGYSFPVQLTQWALASTPQHPVLSLFLSTFNERVKTILGEKGEREGKVVLKHMDPLNLTGPEAVTVATKEWLSEHAGLDWLAVTGLKDGGRSKVIKDVMILPITGFSPGRGSYGNMGSKPLDHPDAKIVHHAQGSWRKIDLTVTIGKLCRTLFGQCKDWSKVPED